MGFCHEDVGRAWVETRIESVVIGVGQTEQPGPRTPDPKGDGVQRMEIYYYDIPDLIAALQKLLDPEYKHNTIDQIEAHRRSFPSMEQWKDSMRRAIDGFSMVEGEWWEFSNGKCTWRITRDEANSYVTENGELVQ